MTVLEVFLEATKNKDYSLILLIKFLVNEKQVIQFQDDEHKIWHYLQPKFHDKMNEHLREFEKKEAERVS